MNVVNVIHRVIPLQYSKVKTEIQRFPGISRPQNQYKYD